MLKRLFLVNLFLIASVSMTVKSDIVMAELLAESFLAERMGMVEWGEVVNVPQQDVSRHNALSLNGTRQAVYAYNAVANEEDCFVLMVQNGSDMRVIGYGRGQHIDLNDMPIAMSQWLADCTVAMESVGEPERKKAPSQAVAPLLNTHWHQLAPFNNYSPTYDTYHTVAGCTAIALAQVLYYYKSDNTAPYKMEYLNEPTMTEISVDYSKGGYDWDNILPEYVEGEYTEEQGNAVARLAYEAGVACRAEYGFDNKYDYTVSNFSTSASLPFVALQRYFDYNCDVYLREFIPTTMWYEIMNEELAEGRPIIYAGSSVENGHAFVVDGVDAEGFYHINWGWGGSYDGYYDINYCQVDDENAYRRGQYMIAGIAPRTAEDEPYKEQLLMAGVGSQYRWNCLTVNCYYDANNPTYNSSDEIGYAVVGDNDEILFTRFETTYYMSDYYYPRYSTRSFHSSADLGELKDLMARYDCTLADGVYRIMPIVGDEYGDTAQWQLAYCPEKLMVTLEVKDGEFTFNNLWEREGTHEVRDMYAASDVYNGSYFYIGLKLFDNASYDPYGTLPGNLYFENIETQAQYKFDINIYYTMSYPGIEDEQIIRVRPTNDNGLSMPEGTYRLCAKQPEDVIFTDEFLLQVDAKPSYPVLDYYSYINEPKQILPVYSYYQNSAPMFDIKSIYSANVVGGSVCVNIYATPVEGGEEIYMFSVPDVVINANSDNSGKYQLPNNFYPLCGEYYFSCRYLTPEGERSLLNPVIKWQPYTIVEANKEFIALTAEPQDLNVKNNAVSIQGAQRVWVEVANNEAEDFSGYVRATFIDKTQGALVEGVSELVSIKAGEKVEVPIIVTFEKVGNYEVYMTSEPAVATYDVGETGAAAITDASGRRFVSAVKVGETGVNGVETDKYNATVVAIYDLQGKKIDRLIEGVNIVLMSDGTAHKIIKRW